MSKLFIEGRRSGYTPEQCGETMTVGELREALNNAVKCKALSDDMPIYLCNDDGYTYGDLNEYRGFFIGDDWDNAEDLELVNYMY